LTHGMLAGMGALVLWIPIRIVIWAVREDGRGLVTGHDAALAPGQLFGAFLIAAAFAVAGGWLGGRRAERASRWRAIVGCRVSPRSDGPAERATSSRAPGAPGDRVGGRPRGRRRDQRVAAAQAPRCRPHAAPAGRGAPRVRDRRRGAGDGRGRLGH